MLKTISVIVTSLILVNASSKFSILKNPKSLTFKGSEKLDSADVPNVIAAALGFYIDANKNWGGLYINDPFDLPKSSINILVEGDNIDFGSKIKSYLIEGQNIEESMDALTSFLKISGYSPIDVNLKERVDSLSKTRKLFGDIKINPKSVLELGNNLKPQLYSEDNNFLQQIAIINALSYNINHNKNIPILININISLKPLAIVHGSDSIAYAEAKKILKETLIDFVANMDNIDNVLVNVIDYDEMVLYNRQKRETESGKSAKELNLATYYNEDYPVIFNIVLWFMIVFVFALLSISYVIGTMDPGRDSIIYRMTSTRIKKEN